MVENLLSTVSAIFDKGDKFKCIHSPLGYVLWRNKKSTNLCSSPAAGKIWD